MRSWEMPPAKDLQEYAMHQAFTALEVLAPAPAGFYLSLDTVDLSQSGALCVHLVEEGGGFDAVVATLRASAVGWPVEVLVSRQSDEPPDMDGLYKCEGPVDLPVEKFVALVCAIVEETRRTRGP
jgi:hypothetical protein